MKKNIIQRLVDKLYKLQKRVQDRVLVGEGPKSNRSLIV